MTVSLLFIPVSSQAGSEATSGKPTGQTGPVVTKKQNQPENRYIYDLGNGWEGEFVVRPILCTSLYQSSDGKPVEIKEKKFKEADALILKKEGKPAYCLIHDVGLIPTQMVLDENLERIAFPTRVDTATFEIRVVSLKTYECRLVDLAPIQEVIHNNVSGWSEKEFLSPVHLFSLRKEGNKAVGYAVYNTLHIKFAVDLAQEWPVEGKDCKLEIIGFKTSDKIIDQHNFGKEIF